jgi:AcrR family transcriptional regulator
MNRPADTPDRSIAARRRKRCDGLANRQRLLVVAKQLFALRGVEQTSMSEIARVAGVGQGTLYRHFANRGRLCQALIRDDLDAFMARTDTALARLEESGSSLARLDQLLVDQIRLVDQHLPILAAIEESGEPPGEKPVRSPWSGWLRGQVTRLLTSASAAGEVMPDLDVDYLADTILAVLAPRHLGRQRRDRGYSLDRIIAGARQLFVERLRAKNAGDE